MLAGCAAAKVYGMRFVAAVTAPSQQQQAW